VVKYSHRLGSSVSGSSSSVICRYLFKGEALVIDSWLSPSTIIFARPSTAGRLEAYALLDCLPAVAGLLEVIAVLERPRKDFHHLTASVVVDL
jgi:hypothetical protein